MTSVSLPAGIPVHLVPINQISSDTICISSSEDQLQNLSKDSMDQIRNTMMRHEELFKEQVQALHKLYNVQKSVMQEIREVIYYPTQLMSSNSEAINVRDGQSHSSVVEGDPFRPTYITSQSVMEAPCSVYPIWKVKEFTGHGMENAKVKASPNAQSVLRKIIDLERPPEEYMDESDYMVEANCSEVPDADANLSEGTRNTVEDSFMGTSQSVLQMDSSLEQRDTGPNFRLPSERNQEAHQDCELDLRSKIHAGCTRKCTTDTQSPKQTLQRNTLPDPWNHLPAVGDCSSAYEESNPSFDQHAKEPSWFLQVSLPLHAQSLACTPRSNFVESKEPCLERKAPEKFERSGLSLTDACLPGSTKLYETVAHNNKITVSQLKLDKKTQHDSSAVLQCHGSPLPTDPAVCSQVSSTLESSDAKGLNHLCIQGLPFSENSHSDKSNSSSWVLRYQTGEDDGDENGNCSGHGSNSQGTQDAKVCCDDDLNILTVKSLTLEGIRSEREETIQFANDDIKPSLSSSIPDSETDHEKHGSCLNSKHAYIAEARTIGDNHEPLTNQDEPVITEGTQEDFKKESTMEEACESIAAKILLSFAPCRSQSTRIEAAELSQCSRGDNAGYGTRYTRRGRNYNNGCAIDEPVKWKKSVRGRRTSRRQR